MKKEILGLMSASVLVAGVVVPVGDVGVAAVEPTPENQFQFNSSKGEITGYTGSSKDVVIPSSINGVAVKSIGEYAFYDKQLSSVKIPGGVTSLGSSAFAKNQLRNVDIPKGVKNIGKEAFYTNQLNSVNIQEGVESIGVQAFSINELTSVVLPDSVKSIGSSAFQNNQIRQVNIPEGVTSVGGSAFYRNQITHIDIPSSVVSIGGSAFDKNPLERVNVRGTPTYGTFVFHPIDPLMVEQVPIYGIVGSTTETYANANKHPFNPLEVDPEEPDEDNGDVGGTTSSTADQNVQLKINAGGLYLDAPEIVDFGEVTLGESAKVIGTKFTDKFKVTDARGTGEGWKLTVKATNFKEVEPTNGFKEGTGNHELPHGSITITNDVAVEQLNGNKGILPSKELSGSVVIDAESPDSVLISQAGINEGMGTFGYTYGEGALKLVVDPSTAKIDRDNYPETATPYESTVTWELVSGL